MKATLKICISALSVGVFFGLVLATAPTTVGFAQEAQYSEEDLRAYAFATASIRLIRGGLKHQLLDVEDEAEVAELELQAQYEMAAAIERAGLTSDEYEEMTEAVAADGELYATYQQFVIEELGCRRPAECLDPPG